MYHQVLPGTGAGSLFGVRDVLPALYEPQRRNQAIDSRFVELLYLCAEADLPYPVVPSRHYATWWQTLRYIAQWAVKPRWYTDYASWMSGNTPVTGRLFIPAGIFAGKGAIDIETFSFYVVGEASDAKPDICLCHDPLPGEAEANVWSLLMLQNFGWPHPYAACASANGRVPRLLDTALAQPDVARQWLRSQGDDPQIRAALKRWRIDPSLAQFRAMDDGFELPYPLPGCLLDLRENMNAIYARYAPSHVCSPDCSVWFGDYLTNCFASRFLAE